MKKEYVTFHFPGDTLGSVNKWAIERQEGEDLQEIASDVYSLDGVSYLRLNRSGKLGKGYKVIHYNNGNYDSEI